MASNHHRGAASMKLARHDASALLTADHRSFRRLFRRFDSLDDDAGKTCLIDQVCTELKVHALLEEELFYSAANGRIEEAMLLDEAQVDHECARQLIEMLETDDLGAERDATFRVLSEYVLHHIEEEENELFRQMRDAAIDLEELGAMMQLRRRQLHMDWGIVDEPAADAPDPCVAVQPVK